MGEINRGLVKTFWVNPIEKTEPGAGDSLVSKTIKSGYRAKIHGIFISSPEANSFLLNWTSGGVARSKRIEFTGRGTVQEESKNPMNLGQEADAGTAITVTVVNASGAGLVYQADILYEEERI